MDALIGQTLDRFQILDSLRVGRHWTVYRAFDPKFQRHVVVKTLNAKLSENMALQEQILQAARVATRMRHVGVARMLDLGQVGELFYLVSEYLPGADLGALTAEMRQSGLRVGLTEAVLVARELASTVDFVRQRGFQLPDLRIDDVMLKPFEDDDHIPDAQLGLPYRPVLVDLGLAASAEADSAAKPAEPSAAPANELYGLVSILYELVTGQAPASAPKGQKLPAPLSNLMRRAFTKNQEERFGSAVDLAQALTDILPDVQALDPQPVTPHGMTPLLAVHRQRAAAVRLPQPIPIVEAEPPAPSDASVEPRLRILDVDHSVRFVPLRPTGITIGRASENDVVLNQTEVSRKHVQISFDGSQYRVTDLGSANGTYLGERKLLPHVPQIWAAGTLLRVGKSFLQIELPGMPESTRAVPLGDQTVGLDAARFQVQEGAACLTVSRPNISVIPGQKASLDLVLENRGLLEDTFNLSVAGVPSSWINAPEEPFRLAPGAQQAVTVDIAPPRLPASRAGRKQLVIQLTSQTEPDHPAEARLNVSVGVFNDLRWAITPTQAKAGQPLQVRLENRGNASQTCQLVCDDAQKQLIFNPPAAQAVVPPEQQAAVEFLPASRQPRLFGADRLQPVQVRLTGSGIQAETRTIKVLNPVLLPGWVWMGMLGVVLVTGFLGLLLVGGFAFRGMRGGQTTSSAATSLAQIVQMTDQSRLSTEQSLSGANVETLQAVTATAAWMDLDDDRDGLTNRQELELKTLPNERDTDQDGVSDGEEVGRGLDPLNPDSDGDSLKDGEEISRGLDPLSRDTDKDGIPDGIDPDPGKVPTPTLTFTVQASFTPTLAPFTPTPTFTATPTFTSSPTSTSTQVINPPPILSGLTPNNVIMGSPNLNMTVNGSNFVNGSQVLWNGAARTTTFVNSGILLVQIPSTDLTSPGNFPVKVRNPAPSGDSGELNFQVRNPQPLISSLSPSSALVNQNLSEISVNGAGFTNGTRVFFVIGVSSSQRTIKSRTANVLTVEVLPADLATAGIISVSVANDPPGGGSAARDFNVNNPVPALNLVNPSSTDVTTTTVGITLTLTGDNFIPTSQAVWVEGSTPTNLVTTFDSKTSLRAFVPVSLLSSPRTVKIRVNNPGPGGGTSPEELNFQIQNPAPPVGWFPKRKVVRIDI